MPIVSLETDGPWPSSPSDNPPQHRINEQMSAEFLVALDKVEADDLGGLLLSTNGPDFCVGGDITNSPEISNRQLRTTFEQYMSVFNRFERLPLPVVAAVQGPVLRRWAGARHPGRHDRRRGDLPLDLPRFETDDARRGLRSAL